MSHPDYNVLFLCTGNSARSILSECLVERLGHGRFAGFSAGSKPKGEVHPLALRLLRQEGYSVAGLRSKDWREFEKPNAPRIDFVFTVCDNAAGETCPVWPGTPIQAHWGIPDPAAVEGTETERFLAFVEAYRLLRARILAFVNLPLTSMSRESILQELDSLGKGERLAKSGS